MLPSGEYRVFLVARFVLAEIKSAATLRISCNTYADALNSMKFCICVIISVPFCPPSWNLLSDLCQTSTTNVRCHYA